MDRDPQSPNGASERFPRLPMKKTRYFFFTSCFNASLFALSTALLAACGGGSGDSSSPTSLTVSGTAATGGALSNAALNFICEGGAISKSSSGNGDFKATLDATAPCTITALSSSTLLHSTAYGSGTFNVTPETELMLVYLAAQLNMTESDFFFNFSNSNAPNNARIRQTLANQDLVLAAQNAVVHGLQTQYAITLSVPNFLTTPFVVGQAGVDSDLQLLRSVGAIDANGEADPAAVSLMMTLGTQQPLTSAPAAGASSTATSAGGASTKKADSVM